MTRSRSSRCARSATASAMSPSGPTPTPRSGRFTPASLGWRLTGVGLAWALVGLVGVVMLICTGIPFVAVYRGTGTQLRHQIDQEIAGDASELSHTLTSSDDRSPHGVAKAASSYVRTQP